MSAGSQRLRLWSDDWSTMNTPDLPILSREPGPFAFVRSADEMAADDANHTRDLRDEHFDNTRWDRD